jgi:hypothetical protein
MAPLSFVYKFNVLFAAGVANETRTLSKEKSKLAGITPKNEWRFIDTQQSSIVSRRILSLRNIAAIPGPKSREPARKYYLLFL